MKVGTLLLPGLSALEIEVNFQQAVTRVKSISTPVAHAFEARTLNRAARSIQNLIYDWNSGVTE